jgi:Ni/Fe-hydrogenase subunit HybB-like protein
MDFFAILFWIGVLTILVSHVLLFKSKPEHSTAMFLALACVFVGSKIGRKFLGIE